MGVLVPFLSVLLLAAAASYSGLASARPQVSVAALEEAAAFTGNPFAGVQMWPNRFYAEQVQRLALPRMSGEARRKAEKVAKVPSFQWM